MKILNKQNGVSLVELMITLAVFSIIVVMIYSVYNTFIKHAASERKTAKTEMDIVNVSWPLIKEIQSAGFGVPTSGICSSAASVSGSTLMIHSTAAGDSQHAGKWSFIASDCSISNIPNGESVVVINVLDRSKIGTATISAGKVGAICNSNFANNLAYWYPSGGDIECYETSYSLEGYSSGTMPKMCANGTSKLSRRVSNNANSGTFQPMLDCVLNVAFRFGCIDTIGSLTWVTAPTACGTSKLRLIKIGAIVQSTLLRDLQVPSTITLFPDLETSLRVTTTLTTAQQNYKWRRLEETVTLRNID